MPELIIAVQDYAGWLYVLLVLLGVRELLVLMRSGREHDRAMFAIEREAATGRAMRALITLFLLSTIGLGVYLVDNVLAPALPESAARLAHQDTPLIETPPTVMLPTDTPTPPPASATPRVPRIVTAPPETEAPTAAPEAARLCRNANMEIVAPEAGGLAAAGDEVMVSVRFVPAPGRRFWLEIAPESSPSASRALGTASDKPVRRQVVGRVPNDLPAGRYILRLVLSEPSGEVATDGVCEVAFRVK
jgi:hypothetical protein